MNGATVIHNIGFIVCSLAFIIFIIACELDDRKRFKEIRMKQKKQKKKDAIKKFNPDTREVELQSDADYSDALAIMQKHYPKKVVYLPYNEDSYILIAKGQAFIVEVRGK